MTDENKELCFVLMPFDSNFTEIYEDAIRPAIVEFGLECLRADEIFDNRDIVEDIENKIQEAVVLVADLTTRNPNVLYEIGYAKALGKEIIMLVQGTDEVPFDIRQRRHIKYGTTGRGLASLSETLTQTLATVVPRARRTESQRLDQNQLSQEISSLREEVRNLASAAVDANSGEIREIMDTPMPVFHTARLNAKRSACQSHLKQLALATQQYAQDYKERLPDCDHWCEAILPYVRNKALFACPASPEREYGFAINAALSGVYLSQLTDPSRTPLFFDSDLGVANACGDIDSLCDPPRHLQFNNIVFADGHCQSVDLETAKGLLWSP